MNPGKLDLSNNRTNHGIVKINIGGITNSDPNLSARWPNSGPVKNAGMAAVTAH